LLAFPRDNDNIVLKIVGAYCIGPYKINSITLDFQCWAYAIRPYGDFYRFHADKKLV